jgi:hypothetical protein
MCHVKNHSKRPGLGLIFWYNLSNGKGTRDFVYGIAASLTTAA